MALREEMKVDVYSHSVKVSRYYQQGKEALLSFCKQMVEYKLRHVRGGKFVREMARVYAASTKDRQEFRFHINVLKDLLKHLKQWGYGDDRLKIVNHSMYRPTPISLPIRSHFKPRDYQVKPIEYIVENDSRTKILVIQTGKGKSLMSLIALSHIGHRVALIIKGMFVDKWIADIQESCDVSKDSVMVVRGSKDLKRLIELGKEDELNAKVIIITNKTLYNYYKAYEGKSGRRFGYECKPEDLFKVLGVGVRLIDEVHLDFHLNFKIDLYSHVPKTVSLSATMTSDDPFINRMYEIMFPLDIRFKGIAFDRYIGVKALFYKAENIRHIRYIGRSRSYSHVMFEQSVMKNPKILKKYLDLIVNVVNTSYIDKKDPGQKMLIFCSSVEMCTVLVKHLKKLYPQLDVRRYVSEDDYSNLLEADVSVSTIKSAGTAVDIPDLRTCLMTDALSSRQANEQTVGRLRRLKRWPDVTPEFLYLVCEDIPQHIRYHERKVKVLGDKVLNHKVFHLGTRI